MDDGLGFGRALFIIFFNADGMRIVFYCLFVLANVERITFSTITLVHKVIYAKEQSHLFDRPLF